MTTSILQWMSLVVLTLSAAVSQAALIASDSFAVSAGGNDYVPNTSILGQNPSVGVTGFVGPWGIPSTGALVPLPGGLTHPLTPGETFDGHLVGYTSDGTVGSGNARNLSRAIDYSPVDGTYYMSMLFQKDAATTTVDLLAGLGQSQSQATSVFDLTGTWIGFVDGAIYFWSGPGPDVYSQMLSRTEMRVNETYFALLEYDYSTSGFDSVTASIYDGSSTQVASQTYPSLTLDGKLGRFSVFTQHFGPITGVDEWRLGTELRDVMVTAAPCDFDGDDVCGLADLNLLLAEGPVAPGVSVTPGVNGQFDLNGDGVINNSDVSEWLDIAASENNLGSPYKPGDANLDGVVDVSDFNLWNAFKFTSTLMWDRGDFNGDGAADVSDFNLWTSSKFTSSDGAFAVPEPATGMMMLLVALVLLRVARERR